MKRNVFKVFLMIIATVFSVLFTQGRLNEVNAATAYYEKVTSTLTDWSGDYLIVYQDGNKAYAFNGTDSTNNYVSATISNNTIESTTALDGVKVTIGTDGSIKTKNGYIYGTSGSNKLNFSSTANKNTFAFESSSIKITSNSSVLRFNAALDQMRFRYYKKDTYTGQKPIQLYKYKEASSEEPGDDPVITPTNYENEVKTLFNTYYNNGVYKKKTVLSVNSETMDEVSTYFHASQTAKERITWHYNGGLRMQVEGIEDSIYEDKDGMVYHTGFNGDWYVNDKTSVESWFTTLYDFKNISNTTWTLENDEYVAVLTPTTASSEHILTKYAREFVAPMWLEPNADNYNYVTFSKLTVQEVNNSLVMTLYATGDDIEGKLTNTQGIFSTATVTKEAYVEEEPGEDPNDPEDTPTTPVDVTISFASTAQRTSFSASKQVWENNGVVLTNNKAASSSDVANYSDPVRFYAGSEIIIEANDMTKISFECSSSSHATALKNSIGNGASVSGNNVIVNLNPSQDTYTISSLTAQVRMNSVTVTCGGATTSGGNENTPEDNPSEDDGNGATSVDFRAATNVKDVTDQGYYLGGCPTTGNVKALVIPVEFSDRTASSLGYTIDKVEKAFNGNNSDTDYYSVTNYFKESSYGKLNLTFDVVDNWFRPSNSSSYYKNLTMDYYGEDVDAGDQAIMDEALSYLSKSMDLSEYDSDDNDMIDAVVLITTLKIDSKVTFNWAYRYWNIYTDNEGYYYEYDGVSANDYLWCPYQFLFEDESGYNNKSGMNTYTFIHEFSHILGADDYYDYAVQANSPLEGCDIMDTMTGDHNVFTKINYGWITSSRLVTTNTSVTLDLEAFNKNGDSIIIANNFDHKLGAYQEYYILMYYKNEGLNGGDAGYFYNDGIVVYHINATLTKEYSGGQWCYDIANNNNTPGADDYNPGTEDNLIEFVKSTSNTIVYIEGYTSSSSVKDDSGNKIAYTFRVDSLTSDKATITFTKNN